MKPNLCQDCYLAAGMGLFAACLALGRFAPAALGQFPEAVTMIFGKSPVVVATILAVVLNLILPREDH